MWDCSRLSLLLLKMFSHGVSMLSVPERDTQEDGHAMAANASRILDCGRELVEMLVGIILVGKSGTAVTFPLLMQGVLSRTFPV